MGWWGGALLTFYRAWLLNKLQRLKVTKSKDEILSHNVQDVGEGCDVVCDEGGGVMKDCSDAV